MIMIIKERSSFFFLNFVETINQLHSPESMSYDLKPCKTPVTFSKFKMDRNEFLFYK